MTDRTHWRYEVHFSDELLDALTPEVIDTLVTHATNEVATKLRADLESRQNEHTAASL